MNFASLRRHLKLPLVAALSWALIAPASGATSTLSAPPPPSMKPETIVDPNLGMTAYSMEVPEDWIFDASVRQGSPCVPGAFVIIRAVSPNGLTGVKVLPRVDWAWSDNPASNKSTVKGDCLDYKKVISADDFLAYMVNLLGVTLVRKEADPNLAAKQAAARNTGNPNIQSEMDATAAWVTWKVNKIQIQEKININVSCTSLYYPNLRQHNHLCSGYTSRSWAPQGKYDDAIFHSILVTFRPNQQWQQAWNAQMTQKIKDVYDGGTRAIIANGQAADARMKAQYNSFQESQDMRQRIHEDFDASIKRGTDMSMQRTGDAMNARGRAADDWADYSLDKQKRLDPNTGVITKDSSAYNYTWVNQQDGSRIQTNDINDNPNGRGLGDYTLQENVR